MKTMTKRLFGFVLVLALLLSAAPGAPAAAFEPLGVTASAPPTKFSVYISVDDGTPELLREFSAYDMRMLARKSRDAYLSDSRYDKMQKDGAARQDGVIYYTAYSDFSQAGRVVTEFVTVEDFFRELGVSFGEADRLHMGTAAEYGWYDYHDLYDTRYYFQGWDPEAKFRVPSIIAMRSYGGQNWTGEIFWERSAISSDYLWAYVVNFGQTEEQLRKEASTYHRFHWGNEECTVSFSGSAAANSTVTGLLNGAVSEAEAELASTVVSTAASEVAEGVAWVTAAQKNTLAAAVEAGKSAAGTNSQVYAAYTAMKTALEKFNAAKRPGSKKGFAWFSEENYAAAETYTLSTVGQLAELAQIVSGRANIGGTLVQHDFAGKTLRLGGDIDLENYNLTIGDGDAPFRGTFDGRGHTLSGLRVRDADGYAALFGNNAGTIKNLTVSGTVSSSASGTDKYAAGIAAYNSGTVEHCTSAVTVSAENAANVGGVVGRNADGTVTDCLNTGDVTGYRDVGGIAGYHDSTVTPGAAVISGCLNAGGVSARIKDDHANAGGIVGGIGAGGAVSAPAVDSCINSGSVTAAGKTAGGIVGGAWIAELTVSNCYNIGRVSAAAGGGNVGALLGRSKATVTNCRWLTGTAAAAIGNDPALPPAASGANELTNADMGGRFKAVTNGYPVLQWQTVYTVGFESDREAVSVEAQSVGAYLTARRPDAPAGFSVAGCYTDSARRTAYSFAQKITADTTVYVKLNAGSSSGSTGGSSGGGSTGGGGSAGGFGGGGGGGAPAPAPSPAPAGDAKSTVKVELPQGAAHTVAAIPRAELGKGNVLVIVNADGSETVIRKSLVDAENAYALLDKSCTVKLADNSKSFADTAEHWGGEAIDFVTSRDLFQGVGGGNFAPNATMNRAMLATVLYRLEDAKASGTSEFADVQADAWYADAVSWASAAAIVSGSGRGFEPERSVTRQELVKMLYYYAKNIGLDTAKTADLSGYADSDGIADWASEPMAWAVATGLVSGRGENRLVPAGTATRAEVAAILQRLVALMVR